MAVHHKVKQLSDEWFKLHEGCISGSGVHRAICARNRLKKGEILSKGAKTYIRDVVGSVVYGFEDEGFDTPAMERGRLLEPKAIRAFEFVHGHKIEPTGFFKWSDWLGCSCDGIVHETLNRKAIAEVKCAKSKSTHLMYCSFRNWEDIKSASPLLFWQMQLALFITGLDRAWFIAYDDRLIGTKNKHLALFTICLEKEEKYIEQLCDSLGRAWVYRDQFAKSINVEL
jgi:hypothetical protein